MTRMKMLAICFTAAGSAVAFGAHAQNLGPHHPGHDRYWYVERYEECGCFWRLRSQARGAVGPLNWGEPRSARLSALKACMPDVQVSPKGSAKSEAISADWLLSRARYCNPY